MALYQLILYYIIYYNQLRIESNLNSLKIKSNVRIELELV